MFGIFTYDIVTDEHLLLDGVKEDGVLSAPAWSPDGRWIAYYKVDPSLPKEPAPPPQTDPNATASTDKSTEEAGAEIQVEKVPEQAETKEVAEELFSEENKMLPSFLLEIVKEKMAEEEDQETFDIKLMVVRPDGKERKVLRVMKWVDDEDARNQLMLIRPEWSPDSADIFYARSLDEGNLYYISSLEVATGERRAHLFSSMGTSAVSPDGKWVASLLKEDALIVAQIDGNIHKYFKVNMPTDTEILSLLHVTWLPDSKRILGMREGEFWVVDTETGNRQKYRDPNTEKVAYPVFSRVDNKLYYLAGYESDEPNAPEERISLKCMNLEDRKIATMFQLSNLPDISDGGIFAISPSAKMVLLRCVMEDESGNKKSALIFWDGKTQKIVETDPWLIEVLNLKNKPAGDNIPDSSALEVDG